MAVRGKFIGGTPITSEIAIVSLYTYVECSYTYVPARSYTLSNLVLWYHIQVEFVENQSQRENWKLFPYLPE